MKTKIEIKNRFTGTIIFEFETENNSVIETVKEFIRQELAKGKSLADLRSADLRSADLSSADLSSADLSSADLSSADLSSANLRSAENTETAYIPLFCKWGFSIIGDKIQIGCESRTIKEWDAFFKSDKELSTKRGTDDFKQIEAVYKACKSYLTHLSI